MCVAVPDGGPEPPDQEQDPVGGQAPEPDECTEDADRSSRGGGYRAEAHEVLAGGSPGATLIDDAVGDDDEPGHGHDAPTQDGPYLPRQNVGQHPYGSRRGDGRAHVDCQCAGAAHE